MSSVAHPRRQSVVDLRARYTAGERFSVTTAWDRPTAEFAEAAGVAAILVGDSLAQVALGLDSTVRVGMTELLHHTAAVVRATRETLVIADMPFLSYADVATASENAGRFLRDAGAGAVKLEGGVEVAPIVAALTRSGVPVIGHIGLTPQSALLMGAPKAQGKRAEAAHRLLADARALEAAGASAIVIELVPAELATAITARISIPTIGIGAGPGCSAQVQVLADLLGLAAGALPRHARPYVDLRAAAVQALIAWRTDVSAGSFPTSSQSVAADDDLRAVLDALPK